MIKKLYALLAASSVLVCNAAQPGITIDGQTVVSAEELQDYVVAGCPELTIAAVQQALATIDATEGATEEQKQESKTQCMLQYVEFMVQRCFFEVLIVVDAYDNGKTTAMNFAQRLPLIAEFEQRFIEQVRAEIAQLVDAQIAEIKQALATARKVDVATITLQDVEAALSMQKYIEEMQSISGRHRAELAEGVVELLIEAVATVLSKA